MAWWTAPSGATAVAAYDAVGAASLADSYVNEVSPGTYNAAPGIAPTWAYGTGWTFNGSSGYLLTGVALGSGYSVMARYTTTGFGETGFGRLWDSTTNNTLWIARTSGGTDVVLPDGGLVVLGMTGGVAALANRTVYLDAVLKGTVSGSAAAAGSLVIGNRAADDRTMSGSIAALAIYSGTLSGADVATITTAMNALPVAGLLPSMLQHAAMGWR